MFCFFLLLTRLPVRTVQVSSLVPGVYSFIRCMRLPDWLKSLDTASDTDYFYSLCRSQLVFGPLPDFCSSYLLQAKRSRLRYLLYPNLPVSCGQKSTDVWRKELVLFRLLCCYVIHLSVEWVLLSLLMQVKKFYLESCDFVLDSLPRLPLWLCSQCSPAISRDAFGFWDGSLSSLWLHGQCDFVGWPLLWVCGGSVHDLSDSHLSPII